MYFLGVDVGTSMVKGAIFTEKGQLIALSRSEYRLNYPHPGWIEIDPHLVWDKVKKLISQLVRSSNVKPEEIVAICPSVLGEAIVPIDKKLRPLYNFIEGWDGRGNYYQEEMSFLEEKIGKYKIYQITGVTLSLLASIHKILWLIKHKPEIYEKTFKFLFMEDFIIAKLTGEYFVDYSLACRSLLFDRVEKKWSKEILRKTALSPDLFSLPVSSGTIVGSVVASVANELGLSKKTKVITGGHDQCCAALGVGIISEGPAFNGMGTVEVIAGVTERPRSEHHLLGSNIADYCYVLKDKYLLLGVNPTFGMALKWFKDIFLKEGNSIESKEDKAIYGIIIEKARQSLPGARELFFLPHLQGTFSGSFQALNPNSRGAFIGLKPFHKMSDVVRAILEGVCFETRNLMAEMEKVLEITNLRVAGGPTSSDLWMKIKANICQKNLLIPEKSEAGLIGTLILSTIATGVYKDSKEAVLNVFKVKKSILPEEKMGIFYTSRFNIFKKIYPALFEIYEKIGSLNN